MTYQEKEDISEIFRQHVGVFESFCNVYWFGSSLKDEYSPHDIDLLLVYANYGAEIINDLFRIKTTFAKLLDLPLDLTVMSVEELEESMIISKLNNQYKIIK